MEIKQFEFTGDICWLECGGTWIMKEDDDLYHVVHYSPEMYWIEIDSFDPLSVDAESIQSALDMMGLDNDCSMYQVVEALFIYGYRSGYEELIDMHKEVPENYISWADSDEIVDQKMQKATRVRIRKELVKVAIQVNHRWILEKLAKVDSPDFYGINSISDLIYGNHAKLLFKLSGKTYKKILEEAGFVESLSSREIHEANPSG